MTKTRKRAQCWALLDQALSALPQRNLLCVAGDFNTDLLPAYPYVGVPFQSGSAPRQPAMDQPRLQAMLAHHQLCALNTWRPEATYCDAQGHASRVDFVLTRLHQAKGRHMCTHRQIRLASWRATIGHVMLGGHIRIDVWRHAPAAKASVRHDKMAIAGPEREHLLQIFHREAHKFTSALPPDAAERLLLSICRETFPLRAERKTALPWQLPQFQSHLQRVWLLRGEQRHVEVPRKSTALRICFTFWAQVRTRTRHVKQLKLASP